MSYILTFYRLGHFTKAQMALFVQAKFISEEQYSQAVGETYALSDEATTDTGDGE